MKVIYIVNGASTACNGIVHWTDSAYTDREHAIEVANRMYEANRDDPNYMTYVTGPIPLCEKIEL